MNLNIVLQGSSLGIFICAKRAVVEALRFNRRERLRASASKQMPD